MSVCVVVSDMKKTMNIIGGVCLVEKWDISTIPWAFELDRAKIDLIQFQVQISTKTHSRHFYIFLKIYLNPLIKKSTLVMKIKFFRLEGKNRKLCKN